MGDPNLYATSAFIAAACSLVTGLMVWLHRDAPGVTALALALFSVSQWTMFSGFHTMAPTPSAQILVAKIQYLGIVGAPTALLFFVLQYTGRGKWLSGRRFLSLLVLPAATLCLVWTNEAHGLIWSRIQVNDPGAFPTLTYHYGPLFYVWTSFAYFCVVSALVFFGLDYVKAHRIYRQQYTIMIIGLLAPFIANIIYLLKISPWPGLDLTPYALSVTGMITALGVFWFRIADITPVAYRTIHDNLPDAVIVLDKSDRIVSLNPNAEKLVGCSIKEAIGRPAQIILYAWPNLLKKFSQVYETETDLMMGEGEFRRYYHLRINSLKDGRGEIIGRLLTTREITEQKRNEQEALHREKLQAVVETTGTVCHEFSQPLQVLLANTELMLMNPGLNESLRKNLEMILGEVERMTELTQRLKNITQYQTKDYIKEDRILDLDATDD